MSYTIPLSPLGRSQYAERDPDIERAVIYLIERMGVANWMRRGDAIVKRLRGRLRPLPDSTPVEGISVRDREDEIGWYIYLGELSIADPAAGDADQGARISPYLSALGRKLEAFQSIRGFEERVDRLLREVDHQDPDQVIFELLIGATYVEEGWEVEAIPEKPPARTPDFLIRRGGRELEVECKRLSRRSDYSTLERDAWLRQWAPASRWLERRRIPAIFTIDFKVEISPLPEYHVFNRLTINLKDILAGTVFEDDSCVIRAEAVDSARISAHMEENWVRQNSSFERQLLTGRYERDYGLTYAVLGTPIQMGDPQQPDNLFWEQIDYVFAAYWRCRAEAALDAKARDVRKRLSDATKQLSGRHEGAVHIGIESSEGDDVEEVRAEKVFATTSFFDPRGKPLSWIYLHYFRSESTPDGKAPTDETQFCLGDRDHAEKPMRSDFVVLPPEAGSRPGVHWDGIAPNL